MMIVLDFLVISLEYLCFICFSLCVCLVVYLLGQIFFPNQFSKNKKISPWDNYSNINSNLVYELADNTARKNIDFVCESVAEWVFECLKNHENKHIKCHSVLFLFRHNAINMDRLYVNMETRKYIKSISPKLDWDWARTNEEIINCLEGSLLETSNLVSEYRKKNGEEPVEVPEKFKLMIRSIFWSN